MALGRGAGGRVTRAASARVGGLREGIVGPVAGRGGERAGRTGPSRRRTWPRSISLLPGLTGPVRRPHRTGYQGRPKRSTEWPGLAGWADYSKAPETAPGLVHVVLIEVLVSRGRLELPTN